MIKPQQIMTLYVGLTFKTKHSLSYNMLCDSPVVSNTDETMEGIEVSCNHLILFNNSLNEDVILNKDQAIMEIVVHAITDKECNCVNIECECSQCSCKNIRDIHFIVNINDSRNFCEPKQNLFVHVLRFSKNTPNLIIF